MRGGESVALPDKKVAPGTRVVRYRCSLPGLAGFTDVASPGTINCASNWLQIFWAAEREGFEPSIPFGIHDFQSCTFGLSVISPERVEEREGFEPPIPLRVLLISNQVHSTALPSLRGVRA